MCGIGGVIHKRFATDAGQIGRRMSERLQHRGPDDDGWLAYSKAGIRIGQGVPLGKDAEVVLVHRRLSIIDLSAMGRQPMSSADGRYHIVFNGEIYNYVELREELIAAGHEFRTKTDTEVLLAAYQQWGIDALPRLVGMFAFAILDVRDRTLLLARDFFGIKPLCYACDERGFLFASEPHAIIDTGEISRQVNAIALRAYLLQNVNDNLSDTFFRDVQRLRPAQYMIVSLDDPQTASPITYWQPDLSRTLDISFEEATKRCRELFLDNIRLHLRSDVPIGTALSGGIDSSSVVMGIREVAGSSVDFHSFSYVADDPVLDEERWVDIAAEKASTTVHKIRIQPEELWDDMDSLILSQNEPFPSMSIYAQYRIFRRVQEAGVKVMLDGQGADELFAGYGGYLQTKLWRLLQNGRFLQALVLLKNIPRRSRSLPTAVLSRMWNAVAPKALRRASAAGPANWLNAGWFADRGAPLRNVAAAFSLRHPLNEVLWESTSQSILPSLLRYEDRNSMAFSVESRVPFLTPALAEFTLRLPEHYLIRDDGLSKNVFRAAMRGIVPDKILDRRNKIGFETPGLAWARVFQRRLRNVLHSDLAKSLPFIRCDLLRESAERLVEGRSDNDWGLWRWLVLVRWAELYQVKFD